MRRGDSKKHITRKDARGQARELPAKHKRDHSQTARTYGISWPSLAFHRLVLPAFTSSPLPLAAVADPESNSFAFESGAHALSPSPESNLDLPRGLAVGSATMGRIERIVHRVASTSRVGHAKASWYVYGAIVVQSLKNVASGFEV